MKRNGLKSNFRKGIVRHWQLYLLLLIPVAWLIIFRYYPMYGLQIAFRDFNPGQGIFGSRWAGTKYFKLFFNSPNFTRLFSNTLLLSLYSILASTPIPIILAISMNECRKRFFSKTVQMVTYMPFFISTVILVAMLVQMTSSFGLLNNVLQLLRMEKVNVMGNPANFRHLYVWSGIWQGAGYSAVIYIAALSGISNELYEAAKIDGASIIQKIWHVDLPSIMPTAIILLILGAGNLLNIGYEKVFLMQNPVNMSVSDIISTHVYRVGLESAQFSYSAAIGFFNSVVSTIIIIIVNGIAKKVSETSLW